MTGQWVDPAWQREARAWIEHRLAATGIPLSGEITQPHVMPWSTAMRVPTPDGPLWFKANGPGTAYEPGLLRSLAGWAAEWTVPVLAVDVSRAWSLQADGGEQLRTRFAVDPDPAHWERALVRHAELQKASQARVAELLELSLPDVRPSLMPAHFDELATADGPLRLRAEYVQWCAELADCGIGPALQHDDLHDNNVLIGTDGAYRFFDWGDAGVAFPFGVLLVMLRSAAQRFTREELTRCRDAYLEVWTDGHDRAELVELSRLAIKVAKVGRALAWQRVLAPLPAAERGPFDDPVAGWMAELAEPDVL
ncbi:phosphotransferase [Kribbella deserti]|uniref:Phosphotransferase n=1 Tax=Kribbella deserti TaxID=1926257 RepID=A0ABV6QJ74_9ACTN